MQERPQSCGNEAEPRWPGGTRTCRKSWVSRQEAVSVPTAVWLGRRPAFWSESARANPQHSGHSAVLVGFIFKLLSPNRLNFLKVHIPPCCDIRDKTPSWAHPKTKSGTSPATHFAGTSWGAAKPCHRTLRRLSPRGQPTKTSSTFIWPRDRQRVTERVTGYGYWAKQQLWTMFPFPLGSNRTSRWAGTESS